MGRAHYELMSLPSLPIRSLSQNLCGQMKTNLNNRRRERERRSRTQRRRKTIQLSAFLPFYAADAEDSQKWLSHWDAGLERAKELVKFVGGVEVGF
jgi:hypothetical protein